MNTEIGLTMQQQADLRFQESMRLPALIAGVATLALMIALIVMVRAIGKRRPANTGMGRALIDSKFLRLAFSVALTWLPASAIIDNGSPEMFRWYTYLSNMLVMAVYAWQTVCCLANLFGKPLRVPAAVKGCTALAILLTWLTVLLILNPGKGPADWLDCRVHYLAPLLTLVEWLLLEPHGKLRAHHPLCWMAVPTLYLDLVLVCCVSGVKFGKSYVPYFFLDANAHGRPFVLRMMALVGGGFLLLGYLMFGFDRLIGRKESRKSPTFIHLEAEAHEHA